VANQSKYRQMPVQREKTASRRARQAYENALLA